MELSNENVKMLLNKFVRTYEHDPRKAVFYIAPLVEAKLRGELSAPQNIAFSRICGKAIEVLISIGLLTKRAVDKYCTCIYESGMLLLARTTRTHCNENALMSKYGVVL